MSDEQLCERCGHPVLVKLIVDTDGDENNDVFLRCVNEECPDSGDEWVAVTF